MKCLWCGKKTESEEVQFCSYWHKFNYRQAMFKIPNPSVLEEWEFNHRPLER